MRSKGILSCMIERWVVALSSGALVTELLRDWPLEGVHRQQPGRLPVRRLAWGYPSPVPENPRIAGLICFRNERVDLTGDGQRLERPVTPWS